MGKNLGDTVYVDFDVTDTSGKRLDEFICQVILLDPMKVQRAVDESPTRLGRGKYRSRLKIPNQGIAPGIWRVKIRVITDVEEETELLTFYVDP